MGGDIVNFVWTTNHNVVPVSAEDYLACITSDTEPVEGPLAWTAPEEEQMVYVICGVRTHCADGNQRLAITVSNSCYSLTITNITNLTNLTRDILCQKYKCSFLFFKHQ